MNLRSEAPPFSDEYTDCILFYRPARKMRLVIRTASCRRVARPLAILQQPR